MPVRTTTADPARDPALEPTAEFGPPPGDTRTQHVATRLDPPLAPVPARLSEQIAHAARTLSDGPVEITLSPEELGRVRMHLQVSDQGVTVVIVAERSETLDLMRRHGDLLTRDIGRLGHDNVSLSFGDPGNSGHAPRGGQGGPSNIQEAADPEGEDRPAYSATSGMDVRL